MTTRAKRWLFIALDLSGLFAAWLMFGTRWLPYFVLAFVAIYLLAQLMDLRASRN